MTLRKKLTFLLLALSVIPAVTVALIFHLSLGNMAHIINQDLEQRLKDQAETTIRAQMVGFTERNKIRQQLIEETLFMYANTLIKSCGRDNIPVNPNHDLSKSQNYFFPDDFTEEDKIKSECILRYMLTVYQKSNFDPDFVLRYITVLENGATSIYPYDSRLNDIEHFDARQQKWYQMAVNSNELEFAEPSGDLFTDEPVIYAAYAVRDESGKIIGVTTMEMAVAGIFEGFDVNPMWANNSEKAIIAIRQDKETQKEQLTVITANNNSTVKGWQDLSTIEEQFGIEQEVCKRIHEDIKSGRSGIERAKHKDKDSIWIYHPGAKKDSAVLLIIPYENIIDAADAVQKEIFQKTAQSFSVAGGTVFIALMAAFIIAVKRAKAITHPVQTIADAGIKLRNGNFDIQVNINTGDELEQLGEIFNQIGPHLKERQTMRQNLELAQTIQKNLLPAECPEVSGYDIGGLCSYCDETGGDYYDYVKANDDSGRMLLALGDVTGHGIPAALLMVSARSLIRSLTSYCCSDLSNLLSSFNKHFLSDTDGLRFMTMFMCVLNPDNSDIYWAAGGHDPAIIYQPTTDSFLELKNTGMLLGVTEEAEYQTGGPVKLASGDVMLIGTDGIWEAHNDYGEMFGKDRLNAAIKQYKDLPAQEIANNILSDVEVFYDNHPRMDDITMIVVKRL